MTLTNTSPSNTAILVIDMQNVIGNVASLLEAGRARSTPIFYSRIVVYPRPGLGGDTTPIFRMLSPDSVTVDSWGAQIVDELSPRPAIRSSAVPA